MAGWAIYIATTSGPSRIQDISVDQHLSHAVMTVNFRTKRAAVTNAYADFVSSDAGLIARYVGEHRFRMKVSHDVQRGDSWQLAAFAAHALNAAGRQHACRGPHDTDGRAQLDGAEGVIWATGILGDDLGVLPVEKIRTKLETSWPLFEACKAANLPVICLIPAANRPDPQVSADLADLIRRTEETFPLTQFRYLDQAGFSPDFWLPHETAAPIAASLLSDSDVRKGRLRFIRPALLIAGGLAVVAIIYGASHVAALGVEDDAQPVIGETGDKTDGTQAEPPVSIVSSDDGRAPEDTRLAVPAMQKIEARYQIVPGGNCFDPNMTKRADETVVASFTWGKVTLIHLEMADLCKVEVRRGNEGPETIHIEHTGLFGSQSRTLARDVAMPVLVGGANDAEGLCIAVSSGQVATGLCDDVNKEGELKPNEALIVFDWN